MGCINSTKKLTDLKNENIFRAVRLHAESGGSARTGYLELTPRELIFRTGSQRVVWSLQHLRRYGLNEDVFTFEAGRRCMTGPGIYAFRCQQADVLYELFQSYVNAVSLVTDEAFAFTERERAHPSHTWGRPDNNSHANNYLEPAPTHPAVILQRPAFHESFSSSPLSLDSPDSAPSMSFATNEFLHYQNDQYSTPGLYENTMGAGTSHCANTNSNLYLEHPLQKQIENNNNMATSSGITTMSETPGRKSLVKRSSLDIPPDECAPMLTAPTEALHMYANVENMGLSSSGALMSGVPRGRDWDQDRGERCYENLNPMDLPLLLQSPMSPQTPLPSGLGYGAVGMSMTRERKQQQQTDVASAVNYIVLDLDPPRSPVHSPPKTQFGSRQSLAIETTIRSSGCNMEASVAPAAMTAAPNSSSTTISTTKPCWQGNEEKIQEQREKEETSQGYSTIDFIKTCALIKSSTHGSEFDPECDLEESRITRHSKCVRKAYSISE